MKNEKPGFSYIARRVKNILFPPLRLLPFPRISSYVGVLQPPSTPVASYSAAATVIAKKVAKAVNATAVNSPLEMVCLPRALAAWQMLHLRRVTARLHFGKPLVREGPDQARQIHAWLSGAGVEVTGYPVAHACVELGFFSRSVPGAASELEGS